MSSRKAFELTPPNRIARPAVGQNTNEEYWRGVGICPSGAISVDLFFAKSYSHVSRASPSATPVYPPLTLSGLCTSGAGGALSGPAPVRLARGPGQVRIFMGDPPERGRAVWAGVRDVPGRES
jgi:hypothetical protein